MGKTRLVAELAGEVHRDGDVVLLPPAGWARGRRAPRLTACARRAARHLLVLDDVDRLATEGRAALPRLRDGLDALPVLVLATAEDAELSDVVRADEAITLAPLDASAWPGGQPLRARGRGSAGRSSGRGERWGPRACAPGCGRVGAGTGGTPADRCRRPRGDRARPPAGRGGRPGRQRRRVAGRSRAHDDRTASQLWSCARSRGWRRSTWRTPGSSSGASGSWPR